MGAASDPKPPPSAPHQNQHQNQHQNSLNNSHQSSHQHEQATFAELEDDCGDASDADDAFDIRHTPFGTPGAVFDVIAPADELLIHCVARVDLEALRPTFVVLFDPDVAFVRELEVYQVWAAADVATVSR